MYPLSLFTLVIMYMFDETIQFAIEKQRIFTEHPLCKHVTEVPSCACVKALFKTMFATLVHCIVAWIMRLCPIELRTALLVLSVVCLSSALSASNTTSCPTWSYYDNSTQQCHCDPLLYCSQGLVEVSQGVCVTSVAGNKTSYYLGICPFRHRFNSTNRMFAELPNDASKLNDVMCGPYNRKGYLCGECIGGYGSAVYSYDGRCANCSKFGSGYYRVIFYLILELTPITLFFIFLVFSRVNITSGPLLGYFIFCQVITMYVNMHMNLVDYILFDVHPLLQFIFKTSLSLCQFWSMHSFFKFLIPPFCISNNLTGIHIQILPLISAVYPVILVIITCILMELHARNCRIIHILWKPFSIILNKTNTTAVTGDAVIQAFASFILLSYFTVLYVLLTVSSACIKVTKIPGSSSKNSKHILYFDPTIKCLSSEHIQYIFIALVPFIFLTLIPSVILTLYSTRIYSRYISRCLSARKRLVITTFAGTRDYRSLAGIFMMVPIIYLIIRETLVIIGYSSDLAAAFLTISSSLLVAHVRPCRSWVANFSISFNVFLMGIICIAYYLWKFQLSVSTHTLELTLIIIPLLPHIVVLVWAGYKVICCINSSGCRLLLRLANLACGVRQ